VRTTLDQHEKAEKSCKMVRADDIPDTNLPIRPDAFPDDDSAPKAGECGHVRRWWVCAVPSSAGREQRLSL